MREQLATEFPGVTTYALELASSYKNLGLVLKIMGEPQASLVWFAKAIAALEPVLKRVPRLAKAREHLIQTHWFRADALDSLERYADAVRDWDRAIELSDGPNKIKFEHRRTQTLNNAGPR